MGRGRWLRVRGRRDRRRDGCRGRGGRSTVGGACPAAVADEARGGGRCADKDLVCELLPADGADGVVVDEDGGVLLCDEVAARLEELCAEERAEDLAVAAAVRGLLDALREERVQRGERRGVGERGERAERVDLAAAAREEAGGARREGARVGRERAVELEVHREERREEVRGLGGRAAVAAVRLGARVVAQAPEHDAQHGAVAPEARVRGDLLVKEVALREARARDRAQHRVRRVRERRVRPLQQRKQLVARVEVLGSACKKGLCVPHRRLEQCCCRRG